MIYLGWIGNLFILMAIWLTGQKRAVGWIYSIAGNICWCLYAINLHMLDVLFIDGIALGLAIRNWRKWNQE
jgi:hypothetical protein